jgi:hypothetical protein
LGVRCHCDGHIVVTHFGVPVNSDDWQIIQHCFLGLLVFGKFLVGLPLIILILFCFLI